MIQRRDAPRWLVSSPIGATNFVASTTSSRRPFSALPTISSDSPDEYPSAVSMKLMPASRAVLMMRTQSSWSGLPHAPNIMAPRQYRLTWIPVVPRVVRSMRARLRNVAVEERAHAPAHPRARLLRRMLMAVLLGAAVVAAVDRRHELAQAGHQLGHLRWGWVIVAVAAEGASLVAFARLQRWLLRAGGLHVGLAPMVEIILAGNALAMSLPGGAAWAAAWAFGQLRRRGADRVLAAWVVLVAGALASFALFLLFVAGALIAGSRGPVASSRPLAVALAAIPLMVAMVVVVDRR